jgi:hypothetical protein
MRIYVGMTVPVLAQFRDEERYGAGLYVAHAVTAALREWYAQSDTEELEHAAFLDAERWALRQVASAPSDPRIRVVVAADVPDATVIPAGEDDDRSCVEVRGQLSLDDVASVHLDEDDAQADIAAAVDAMAAAARGDDDAQFAVDGAEAHDLLWYDASELEELVDDLIHRYGLPPPDERAGGAGDE